MKSKRPHMMDVACRYVHGMQCSAHRMHAGAPRMNRNISSGSGSSAAASDLHARMAPPPLTLLQRNMCRQSCSQGGCEEGTAADVR